MWSSLTQSRRLVVTSIGGEAFSDCTSLIKASSSPTALRASGTNGFQSLHQPDQ
jgi:hypothetical protein